MGDKKGFKGTITIFLSMIILLVIAIIFTSLELVRVNIGRTRASDIDNIASLSLMSEYNKELFEDYGIMAIWESDEGLEKIYADFAKENTSYTTENDGYLNDFPADFIKIKFDNVGIEPTKALDNGGESIYKQICKYMSYDMTEDVINEILDKEEVVEESSYLQEYYDKMGKISEDIMVMEDDVRNIGREIIKIHDVNTDIEQIFNTILDNMEIIMNSEKAEDFTEENVCDFVSACEDYKAWLEKNRKYIYPIYDYTDDFKMHFNYIQNEVTTTAEEFKYPDSDNPDLIEICDDLKNDLLEMKDVFLSEDTDAYKVFENEGTTKNIEDLINYFDNNMSFLNEKIDKYAEIRNERNMGNDIRDTMRNELINDGYNSYVEATNALNKIKEYKSLELCVNYTEKGEENNSNTFIDTISNLKENGIISLIATNGVSEKKIDNKSLPSKVYSVYRFLDSDMNGTEYGDDVMEKILFSQYVQDKFSSYVSEDGEDESGSDIADSATLGNSLSYEKNEKSLDYEEEYIISGKTSDKENLESVTDKILLMRSGMNLLYLIGSEDKKLDAFNLAEIISGWTNSQIIVKVTQYIILACWAYAEAIVDLRYLLKGEKVVFIKDDESFVLDLDNVLEFETERDGEQNKGLSYKDYMRFLLLSGDTKMQTLRVMDIIELNLKNKYNEKFSFSDCVTKVWIDSEYTMNYLFLSMGFLSDFIGENKGWKNEIIRPRSYYS
ncbi:hypothetical protein SAMN02910289_01453 [Lachnospiraceae bacterium RM5]|nr:hypothetical protein SAMN02910289_01453 [Lachnospiraceae bacterium RM5]